MIAARLPTVALLAALLLGGTACAPSAPPPTDPPAVVHHPLNDGAPVRIGAEIDRDGGVITLRFDAGGRGVRAEIYGASGLELPGEAPSITLAEVSAGRTAELPFVLPPGAAGDLAVLVEGVFDGRSVSRAASFTVGEATRRAPGESVRRADGRRLRVQPAGRRPQH